LFVQFLFFCYQGIGREGGSSDSIWHRRNTSKSDSQTPPAFQTRLLQKSLPNEKQKSQIFPRYCNEILKREGEGGRNEEGREAGREEGSWVGGREGGRKIGREGRRKGKERRRECARDESRERGRERDRERERDGQSVRGREGLFKTKDTRSTHFDTPERS